jgi:hypothetical protein
MAKSANGAGGPAMGDDGERLATLEANNKEASEDRKYLRSKLDEVSVAINAHSTNSQINHASILSAVADIRVSLAASESRMEDHDTRIGALEEFRIITQTRYDQAIKMMSGIGLVVIGVLGWLAAKVLGGLFPIFK